ncbi:hypothetical protein HK102_009630 [Quaeritorhiza haematococci]|nr:hypothetical protein HK102_009630 [Quaeritorhiza haematococci]
MSIWTELKLFNPTQDATGVWNYPYVDNPNSCITDVTIPVGSFTLSIAWICDALLLNFFFLSRTGRRLLFSDSHYVLIAALIMADFALSSTALVVLFGLGWHQKYAWGPVGCWVTGTIFVFTAMCSIGFLAMLSLERYLIVKNFSSAPCERWAMIMGGMMAWLEDLMRS